MGTVKENVNIIREYLPTWERALAMSESYMDSATWIFRSVTRQQLINEMLPAIYGKRTANCSPDEYSGPHDLALLFSVFALGSVLDTSLPTPTSESEGEHYNQLALGALCQQPVLEKPSVITIQTLHILSVYNAMLGGDMSGGESTMESTWSLVAVACHLAQTVRQYNSILPNPPYNSRSCRLDYVSSTRSMHTARSHFHFRPRPCAMGDGSEDCTTAQNGVLGFIHRRRMACTLNSPTRRELPVLLHSHCHHSLPSLLGSLYWPTTRLQPCVH